MERKLTSQSAIQSLKFSDSLFIVLVSLLLPLKFSCGAPHGQTIEKNKNKIIIEAMVLRSFHQELDEIFSIKDVIRIKYIPFRHFAYTPAIEAISGKVTDGKVKWVLYSNEPVTIIPPFGHTVILSPGDSLHINYSYRSDLPIYSGRCSQAVGLVNSVMQANEKLIKPLKKKAFKASSLSDFNEWNHYLDSKLALQIPIIESYRDKILLDEYEYYKAYAISITEKDRITTFNALRDSVKRGYPGLSFQDLNPIFDSIQCKPYRQWIQSLETYHGSLDVFYDYNTIDILRRFSFEPSNDSLNSDGTVAYLQYANAKEKYKGTLREKMLLFIISEKAIGKLGIAHPMTQDILKDYYSQPEFLQYKELVKKLENNAKSKMVKGS